MNLIIEIPARIPRPNQVLDFGVVRVQGPQPLRPALELGEGGRYILQLVLEHEGNGVSQRDGLCVEPKVLLVEFLERQLGGQDSVPEIFKIGDCSQPRNAREATDEATEIALGI